MTNKQTIDGVPRYIGETKLVGNYYPAQCTRCGWLGSSSELTDEAECTRQASEGLCLGYTEEVEASRLLDIIQAMARPATQPQGEPVPITDDMNRLMVAYAQGEFGLEGGSETVEAMSVASFDSVKSHGHDADSYTAGYCAALYEQAKPFVWLALRPKAEQPQGEPVARVEVGADRNVALTVTDTYWLRSLKGLGAHQIVQPYAEQPAPVAVVPTYKPGLYAVRHIDNWDGERDVALTFAMLDADGKWTDNESGAPLLTYQGDKILRAWPLDCSEAPDTQIIGVSRNWLEDWALELVEAAQDGGTMSNQVEHLLQLHPKQ